MAKVLSICLSSTIQKTVTFDSLTLCKVNRSKSYRFDASGKAVNSSRVLNQLEKGCVITVCPVGVKNADLFIELAKQDGLNMNCVEIPGFTRECCTLLDKANASTTELVIGEPSPDAEDLQKIKKAEQKLLGLIDSELPSVDAVLLAGSKPSFWSENLYAVIAQKAVEAKKIFLADYWAEDLLKTLKITVPSIIKINDEEFCKTFYSEDFSTLDSTPDSKNQKSQKDFEQLLKSKICEKSKELNNIIVVTRGTAPTFAAEKGIFHECPVEKIKPVNTTACGDSFNAGFLYEYLNSNNIEKALQKGTWCAARNAESECPGTCQN